MGSEYDVDANRTIVEVMLNEFASLQDGCVPSDDSDRPRYATACERWAPIPAEIKLPARATFEARYTTNLARAYALRIMFRCGNEWPTTSDDGSGYGYA